MTPWHRCWASLLHLLCAGRGSLLGILLAGSGTALEALPCCGISHIEAIFLVGLLHALCALALGSGYPFLRPSRPAPGMWRAGQTPESANLERWFREEGVEWACLEVLVTPQPLPCRSGTCHGAGENSSAVLFLLIGCLLFVHACHVRVLLHGGLEQSWRPSTSWW